MPIEVRDEVDGPVAQQPARWRWINWRSVSLLLLALVPFPVWLATTGSAKLPSGPPPALPAVPVAAARVMRTDLDNEITVPAEFRPYAQVELHAKVSGYLETISVDVGDRVKTGELLAKLEVPESRDELNEALAAQKRAEADYRNAHLVYSRLMAVEKDHPNLVAQQELDTAEAKDRTAEAAAAAAKADVEKYQTMLAYTRISAPFDGVITKRYADPGALIQAGTASATQSLPLVAVSDNYRLRLDFPVSVGYVKDIQVGAPVEVRVQSLGGKRFSGTIARSTQTVDEATRSMMTEVEVPNPKLELVPGMYATVMLKVERRRNVLTIPTEAVSGSGGTSVYVINHRREIEERTVALGLETSTRYEVTAGLEEGDLVLVGSRAQVRPGQKVQPKLVDALAQQ
ncbi:MAG TPA: efflux RND transporter periplasmic adaptor subunit [Verrucomicrobiae bacterium]